MAIRNATPLRFLPTGLTDAIDQSSAFPGACQSLQNLTFDRLNRGAVIPRPGVVKDTAFGGFTSPGVISVMMAVGTQIYGMIASGLNTGYDQPFCYDTVTKSFVTVSGITSGNVPTTPSTSGSWTPPTMDVVGTYVIVTHPGFSGSNYFGYFNIANPAAPTWSAGNTATNALPTVPIWVAQFYGRAYFGCGNKVVFTDSLNPLNISNTNFAGALTIGDTTNTVGAAGLPMSNTTGGVLQALIVFKGNSIYEIAGDITASSLSLNTLSANVGCISPRTIVSTPYGVVFIASDGPRFVGLNSMVQYMNRSDAGMPSDVVYPFSTATYPSRMCAAYNNGIYRVAFDTSISVWNTAYTSADYWHDFIAGRWNGIHTFPYHCATSVNGVFYLASNTNPGAIFTSKVVPDSSTVYTDNGAAYTVRVVSACIAGAPMAESSVVESSIELGNSALGVSYYIVMYDDQNNPLSIATLTIPIQNPKWGTDKFGMFSWRSSIPVSHTYTIPWVNPIVGKKLVFSVTANAAASVSIKESMHRVQVLGYQNK